MRPLRGFLVVAGLAAAELAAARPTEVPSVPAGDGGRADPLATVDVRFTLTDPAYHALAGVPVRLVFAGTPGWQRAHAGQRGVTDASGEVRLTTQVAIDGPLRKRPTNFLASLVTRPEPTDHLVAAAELTYLGRPWLYTVELFRFRRDGTMLLGATTLYTRDAAGDFTRAARRDADGGWHVADLPGRALTTPGHTPWDVALAPAPGDTGDATGRRWTLRLSFMRHPEPVPR